MTTPLDPLPMYLHLARAGQARQAPWARDRLLVLAAAAAQESGLETVAARCRELVLEHNRAHALARYPTMAEALGDADFEHQLQSLRRAHSPERLETWLDQLGIDLAQEAETYFSRYEYMAALLGTTPEELERRFPPPADLPGAGGSAGAALDGTAAHDDPYRAPRAAGTPVALDDDRRLMRIWERLAWVLLVIVIPVAAALVWSWGWDAP